jgi:hypothetical protein
MEAASAAPIGVASSKRASLSGASVGIVVAGAVVAIVGLFLKGYKVPAGITNAGNTHFISSGGGKVVLGATIVALIFVAISAGVHRKGVLWGTYVFTVIVIAVAAIDAGGGFTLTLVDGSTRKADAAIGVFVSLVGGVIMLIGAIAARQSAKPAA